MYRQAGELLAALHAQSEVVDESYEHSENAKSHAWLAKPHRISAATVETLHAMIDTWPTPPAVLVPTHGDWQPRNWIIDRGIVSGIDLGRAALRPALSNFTRLASREFLRAPACEAAFIKGYGCDPREVGAWSRACVRAAIDTTAWAYQVGDEAFEAQGHRMIADALSREPTLT